MAAREQALSTRFIEAGVYHSWQARETPRPERRAQGDVVIIALWAVTQKLSEWLQLIWETMPEISVQKSTVPQDTA